MAITHGELQRLIDVADLDFGSGHDVVKAVKSITSDYDRAMKTIAGLDYNRTVKTIIAGYPKFNEIARAVGENVLTYQTSADLLAQKMADAQSSLQSLLKPTPLSVLKNAQDFFSPRIQWLGCRSLSLLRFWHELLNLRCRYKRP